MIAYLEGLSALLGFSLDNLVLMGVALGTLLAFWGGASALAQRNPAADRMAASHQSRRMMRMNRALLQAPDAAPKGFMTSFIPATSANSSALRRKLAQAGFAGAGAVHTFTLTRVLLALLIPGSFLTLVVLSRMPPEMLPYGILRRLGGLTTIHIFQILGVLTAVGYYGPLLWLSGRVKDRQRRITEAFPNALDLLQISLEAGLGFDAAMTRVGNELVDVSPDIAFEFLSVQRQVQAGRAREDAMHDMAARTGVEVVKSFANVIQQSMQFGTSMSGALSTYANELRLFRELQAQEMANKLPVKMSAVLASLMLPALILLTVGPVLIRYIRFFAE